MTAKITKFILLTACIAFTFALFCVEIKDPDFWWHLKTGEHIVETGSIPTSDPFAYTSTPKDPLSPDSVRIKFILAQYWLAQILFYKIFDAFGFEGVIFTRAFIFTLFFLFLYICIRREGLGVYSSLLLAIPAVLILKTFTGERPQMFSFLFSFLIVFLLEGFRKSGTGYSSRFIGTHRDSKTASNAIAGNSEYFRDAGKKTYAYLIPVPFILLLWSNMHGGFIVGIALLLCYLVAEWIKYFWFSRGKIKNPAKESVSEVRGQGSGINSSFLISTVQPLRQLKLFSAFIVASMLLTLINPNTYKVIPFLIEFESEIYKSFIVETMSPIILFRYGFYEIQFFIFFALAFIVAGLFLFRLRCLDLTDVFIVLMLAAVSFSMSRFIPYFAPVALVIIARHTADYTQRLPQIFKTIRKNIEIPVNSFFIIVIILMLINGNMFKKGVLENKYPEGAAKFLKDNPVHGNMFNPYVWGGYLIWALYPDYKVFIDGRGLIPEVFFQEVRVFGASQKPVEGLPEWKAFLNAYKVNSIVMFSVGNFSGRLVPLIPAILNDPEWHLVYMDNISLVFVRDSVGNREIIRRFSIPKEWLWNEVVVEAALKAKDAPNRANYYETMGDAFFAKRRYQEAREAYVKAFALKPGDTGLRNRIEQLDSIMRMQ